MARVLWLDTETFNGQTDIAAGAYEYARTAELLLVPFAINNKPVSVWAPVLGEPAPDELQDAMADPAVTIIAHNAGFDRPVVNNTFEQFMWLPEHATQPERWRCTMAQAFAHGFPGGLDQLGSIFGLPTERAKIKDGKALIRRFCVPAPSNHKADRYDWRTHPEEWERFVEYARRDVEAMREIAGLLPTWNYRGGELTLWHLDQTVNDRGFAVDRDLAKAGAAARERESLRFAEECVSLTGGEVSSPGQRAAIKDHLNNTFGLELENTRADTLQELVLYRGDTLPADAARLIYIVRAANKTSTAKYARLLEATGPDGRFRGGLQFAGAQRTRRWAGRIFQTQNLPSRGLPDQDVIDQYREAVLAGIDDLLYDDAMLLASAAIRGVVVAPKGRKLVVADLSNIEGRALAWLAGETWKLEAFAAFDRKEGPDLYNVTAGQLLGKAPDEITKSERNAIGKVPELALGYQGGVGALRVMAKAYGVRFIDMRDALLETMGDYVAGAQDNWSDWGSARPGANIIGSDEWIAAETVKLAWRDRHPAVKQLWWDCENAARAAIQRPGTTHYAGPHLLFKALKYAGKAYLVCRLPSGCFLVYFAPRVDAEGRLSFMGVHQETKQWTRIETYGGKLVENACQSVSRDILAASMPAVDRAGYRILFTVHDEIVTEAPDDPAFNAEELSSFMIDAPEWASGVPLAAAGFEDYRYRKD